MLPFALTMPDLPAPRSARPPWDWRAFARSFWLSPRRYPDFAWAWLTRFAVNLGNAMTLLYLLYFRATGCTTAGCSPVTRPRTA